MVLFGEYFIQLEYILEMKSLSYEISGDNPFLYYSTYWWPPSAKHPVVKETSVTHPRFYLENDKRSFLKDHFLTKIS
jgi:hypothetical protein